MNSKPNKITTHTIQKMKNNGEKIAMLTAYDFSFARIFDQAGIDILLVGDSASNTMAGHETTIPITLDQMIYHGESVVRAAKKAMVVIDLPFGSYQTSKEDAIKNAIRVMKETRGHAVKLEGGIEMAETIQKIVEAGIPVMGHLGLTPQSIYKFGTYATRAKEKSEEEKLRSDILALQNAGCFAIVVEKIPANLAKEITQRTSIPIIGIGAGPYCDGQVLVMHDLLGMQSDFSPRFIRKYASLEQIINTAVESYCKDVKSNDFPNASESYS